MSDLSKAYEPQEVEKKWYAAWLEGKCFEADPESDKPAYSIVIPPPNVTGILHLGHVLNNSLQDILARRARQTGHEVLWLPGTDHAGIATQAKVERDEIKRAADPGDGRDDMQPPDGKRPPFPQDCIIIHGFTSLLWGLLCQELISRKINE